jgi:NAD(P)H-hydrate epimerase
MRIVSINEMKEIEHITSHEFFMSERLIIENVAHACSKIIHDVYHDNECQSEVLFLVGKGNNGADAVASARHLNNLGVRSRAFVLFNENECHEELNFQIKMARSYGVAVNYIDQSAQLSSYIDQMGCELIIDGIFGTGVQLPLSNFMHEVIDIANQSAESIISFDIPSGVEGDTGIIRGKAIKAELTLAIGFAKLGHYIADGAKHCGELYVVDVGIPSKFNILGDKFLLRPEHMVDLVGKRDRFADKKIFGHSLVLGGSHGLTGAAALCSLASLKAGSGLVTAATWEPQYQEMISRLSPEIMTGYLPLDFNKWNPLIRDLNKYSSIVIGPGLARSSRARRLVLEVLNNFDGPVIIDADAINVLSLKEDKNVFTLRNAPTVITPHFGEFARFAGVEMSELNLKPVHYLKQLVETINCTVVLKGPCTYLGCSDGSVYFNYFPNDGMATAGAGDVLAGILGGLLGQEVSLKTKDKLINRYETFNRIIAVSIYLHSAAGKYAAKKLGVRAMSAQTIIESFPEAFKLLDEDLSKVKRI